MTTLDWSAFDALPGSQTANFEKLCRALIKCHYGKYGIFDALANQPGVEFHLRLHSDCSLGQKDQWFGWQCRWFDILPGRALGSARRDKIADALAKSAGAISGLTDWVLWTRHPLTAGDQKWLRSLKTRFHVHMWTSADVEELLRGDGILFRETYFGELILTEQLLAEKHAAAIATIRKRWLPEVHQAVAAERQIRRMLGEGEAWNGLLEVAKRLKAQAGTIKASGTHGASVDQLAKEAMSVAEVLSDVHKSIKDGDLEVLPQALKTRPKSSDESLLTSLRELRGRREKAALFATNLMADMQLAMTLLDDVRKNLTSCVVAVCAGPGGGKTQLSAELTMASKMRPAGMLLFGRAFQVGHTLDNLAQTITIHGHRVETMESLIAAVDAAGQRSRTRLPIVIDGLNEAEDPRKWKAPLAALAQTLQKYNHVLVVCTARSAFAEDSIPADTQILHVEGFEEDVYQAIEKYFKYYKIKSHDAELPVEMLKTPLTLRLFCEVTNRARQKEVGVEAMPGSLTALFDRYLENACERIAELSGSSQRYFEHDVRLAIDKFGEMLWSRASRHVSEKEYRQAIGDDTRPWDKSLDHALEDEGVLLRIPIREASVPTDYLRQMPKDNKADETAVVGLYDVLAGHIIADSLVCNLGSSGVQSWFENPENQLKLTSFLNHAHPLAGDIFSAVVALLPRRLHKQQLWPLLAEPLRTAALRDAAELEGTYLDKATVDELRKLETAWPNGVNDLFNRLFQTRRSPAHPLNAEFLDSVLRPMPMADRDLRWTEWLRQNGSEIAKDIEFREHLWREGKLGGAPGRLTAVWIMWTLTSTIRALRDCATRALYWYGRNNATELFALTLESLKINDMYVPERMLAASYGTAMALHHSAKGFKDTVFPDFALKLYAAMFKEGAPHATKHALARDYARHMINLALLHKPNLLSKTDKPRVYPPFPGMKDLNWRQTGVQYTGHSNPIRMDFGNYTIGGLVEGRGNYHYEHPEYQQIVQSIHWRIYDLGYDDKRFQQAEERIGNESWRHGRSANGSKTDRYGKKYSWIAYFEMAGERADKEGEKAGRLSEPRLPDIDIDPSFPDASLERKLLPDTPTTDANSIGEWLKITQVPAIKRYLMLPAYESLVGRWVMLDGSFVQVDERGYRLYCRIRNLMAKKSVFQKLSSQLRQGRLREVDLEGPSFYYTFVGEAAWADTYPACGTTELRVETGTKQVRRKVMDFISPLSSIIDGDNGGQKTKVSKYELFDMPIYDKFNVLIPIVANNWESYHTTVNSGDNPSLIGRELCAFLKLHVNPSTSEFFDNKGVQASLVIKSGHEWAKASQEIIFLRQDLYNRYLEAKGLAALWIVSGTREVEVHHPKLREIYERHGGPSNFREVIDYSPRAAGRGDLKRTGR